VVLLIFARFYRRRFSLPLFLACQVMLSLLTFSSGRAKVFGFLFTSFSCFLSFFAATFLILQEDGRHLTQSGSEHCPLEEA